jgi:hypothetical protein
VPSSGIPEAASGSVDVPKKSKKSGKSKKHRAKASGAVAAPVSAEVPAGASGSIDVAMSNPGAPAVPASEVPPGASGSIEVAISEPVAVPKPDVPTRSSGSIDVAVSNPGAPAVPKSDVPAGASGSIDVALSGPLPREDGAPEEITGVESIPVTSGRVTAVAPAVTALPDETRGKRLSEGMKDALGDSVSAIGTGIGTIGGGVSKLGEKSRNVPLVGSSVAKLGKNISHVGESLHDLPRAARTRRGRLLLRSLIVGFVLVGAWITIIVVLQMRRTDVPDFRPNAERILSGLSDGSAAIEEVYEQSSPRFQEMVRKEAFVDDMTDLHTTVGDFREITSVNDTLVTTGPTGRVGRVGLTIAYEKGKARGSVSLHWHEDRWKLLGVGVELPPEVQISQAQREERVQVCNDPMDPKTCDVFVAANEVLEQLRDGKAEQVWDNATPIFQKQEEKGRFKQIQAEHFGVLGEYRRIIAVTEAKTIRGLSATFDVLTEYAKSQGVRAIFGFLRQSKIEPWKLRSLKIVLPMPRADDLARGSAVAPPITQPVPTGGSGSAGSGSAKPSPPATRPKPVVRPKPAAGGGAGSGSATGSGSAGSSSAGSAGSAGSGSAK